jgi:hypothetical protein
MEFDPRNNGDLLTAGRDSNYQTELTMNHIYFTALANGAGLAAALAKGDGRERVYIVEPTGSFENDPNVTDKKFPGNPTRSYRFEGLAPSLKQPIVSAFPLATGCGCWPTPLSMPPHPVARNSHAFQIRVNESIAASAS